MQTIYSQDFQSGWKQFGGGEWATIVTPEDGGTAYPVRPDGSLCEPRPLRRKERKELKSLESFHSDLRVIAAAIDRDVRAYPHNAKLTDSRRKRAVSGKETHNETHHIDRESGAAVRVQRPG